MLKNQSQNRRILFISILLAVLILIAYEPVRHNEFVNLDDNVYITENPAVRSGLAAASVKWAFTTGSLSNWHPLTWLSHMLDYELFGLRPAGHHLHNVLLHILSAVLLFLVLQRMTGNLGPSAFVAVAFGLHPLHVESVAWAAERKDVLCGLFWMLTLAAYLGYVRRGGLLRYLLVLLCFVLGLMAKPMIVTLPFVLLILDFWPLRRIQFGKQADPRKKPAPACRRESLPRLILEKVPLFLFMLASCLVTYWVQQKGGAMEKIEFVALPARAANAVISYWGYIGKMIYPLNLAALYPHPGANIPLWQPILAAAGLLACTGFVIFRARRNPCLVTGWLWYIGTLVPVLGLVQVGSQAMADRYTYLPSIGLFITAAWGTAGLFSGWKRGPIVLRMACALLLCFWLIGTRIQVSYWKDSSSLFGHALKVTRNNYEIHIAYASLLAEKGQPDLAREHLIQALQIKPDHLGALNNLGLLYINQGLAEKALPYFLRALKTCPPFPEDGRSRPELIKYYGVLNNLGMLYMNQNQPEEARRYFSMALQADPDSPDANNHMANLLIGQGDYAGAAEHIDRALGAQPAYAAAYYNLGRVLQARGLPEKALSAYEKAISLGLSSHALFHRAGVLRAQLGFLKEAETYIRTSIRIYPDDAETHRVLGLIMEKQGRIEEAVGQYRIALQIEPDDYLLYQALGYCLSLQGKHAEAVRLAERACELTAFENAGALDALAAAYAGDGQFDKAVDTLNKAIARAQKTNQINSVPNMQRRLELYKAGRAYPGAAEK